MKTRRDKQTDPLREQFWRRTLADPARSDLTIQAYCRRHSLNPATLSFWRQELARRDAEVFVSADQHGRWELNDLAERLDSKLAAVEPCESLVPAPARSASGLSPDGYHMLPAEELVSRAPR
jgi:transposase-like protein